MSDFPWTDDYEEYQRTKYVTITFFAGDGNYNVCVYLRRGTWSIGKDHQRVCDNLSEYRRWFKWAREHGFKEYKGMASNVRYFCKPM